jgi:ribosomal protein S27E
MAARTADYADLTLAEMIAEINETTGAKNTKGEGAGQSTYEPPRTEAATVNDAAHVLREHGPELAVASTVSERELEVFKQWWQEYLAPYGGGATIPAKVVRVTADQAAAARERLAPFLERSCPSCGTSPLVFVDPTLTLRCPQCATICFVSFPQGMMNVGRKRTFTPGEEMEATWGSRENR